ncbi:MAG: sulfite exporter TauE/SafE family protein [Clostridia bacterium]|nr:sulfite exporter TauE/SafE family protein [Clostridia bacterium]
MNKICKKGLTVIVALLIGFANGFFGGGGGMLLVPLLDKGLGCSVKKSHATAVAIILPVSLAGAITYIINGFAPVLETVITTGGCIAGGVVGALLLKKLPSGVVGIIFSLFMLASAVKLIFF